MRRSFAAVGFDFDHTLGVDNGLECRALYLLAEDLGRPIPPEDRKRRAELERLLTAFRGGDVSLDDMLARFAAGLGLPAVDPDAWRARCFALVDSLVRPVPGARDVIAALERRAIPVAILTNGWSPLQQMKIARALGRGTIETILVSDQLGVAKPAVAAFDALLAALGVPRHETWYVGDNARADVGGALAAGLQAVWLDAEGQAYPSDQPPPALVIHDLRELEACIENTLAP
jgi:FMN phosphatase YigB (HAD superfamily)